MIKFPDNYGVLDAPVMQPGDDAPRSPRRRIRMPMAGIRADVSPELMRSYALDAVGVTIAPDGQGIIAPCGGRTKVADFDLQSSLTAEEGKDYIFKLDPALFGRSTGSLLIAIDSDDVTKDLRLFSGDRQYALAAPIQDVQPPAITLTNPQTGQTIYGQTTGGVAITWDYSGTQPNGGDLVNILLYDSTGALAWDVISAQVPATPYGTATTSNKSYTWTVPNSLDGQYSMKIVGSNNQYYYYETGLFTIEPSSLHVWSPQTGTINDKDSDGNATVVIVSWKPYHYCGNTADVDLRRTSTGKIADLTTQAQTNDVANSYEWTVPDIPTGSYVAASDYFIRVTDNSGTPITDDGAEFSLFDTDGVVPDPDPAIDLDDTGYAGKSFAPGESINITWTETWGGSASNLGGASDRIEIWLRSDLIDGVRQSVLLGSLAVGNSFLSWTVTANPGGDTNLTWSGLQNYWIEIFPTNGSITAVTSSKFTILANRLAKQLYIENPAGGNYHHNTQMNIVWNDVNNNISGTVTIELYRFYDKRLMATIASATSSTNVAWTIPPTVLVGSYTYPLEGAYYIEISSDTDTDVQAVKSLVFGIYPAESQPAYMPVWSRTDSVHEIWRAELGDGSNCIPEKFVTWAQTAGIEDASGYDAANGGTTFPTVREMVTDKDQNLAVVWMDAYDDGVGKAVFTGSGLNDAASGGTYSGTGPLNYRVEIDGTGTPDTFQWSDDGGSTWDATGVSITGAAQTLNNGVTVTFDATTGHTSADRWDWDAADKFPRWRIGDTGRVKLYDSVGGDEIWAADCASAIRTYESAADTVTILEHAAIATGDDRTVFVAFAGWTLTGATYARKLWVQRIDGSDGTIDETYGVSTADDSVSITGTEQVGLCAIYGACWAPENRFYVVCDHKRWEDGTNAYDASEYVGRVWRFDGTDLTNYDTFQPQPEGAAYAVYTGISYRPPGVLLVPVFYLWDEGTTDEYRQGLMKLTSNGKILSVTGFGYDTADTVHTSACHPGGSAGFERNSLRVDTYEVNRQEGVLTGGMVRPSQVWLTDGRDLHYFDTEHNNGFPRRVSVGGTVGAGTNHTYNCHALSRLSNGDLVSTAFEYQDSTFANSDLRVRLQVREPQKGSIRYEITKDFDSADPTDEPYLPQPFRWLAGPDANGNDTESTADDFPWVAFAVNGPKKTEET